MPKKLKVAHISTTYLKSSESYIYSFIKNYRAYKPFVITEERVNKNLFPTDKVYEIPKVPLGKKAVNLVYRERFFRKKALENYYLGYLEKERPNVVLCHYGPAGVYSLPFRKALKIPVITFFYGLDLSFSRLEKVMGKTGGKFSIPIFSRKHYWKDALKHLFKYGDYFVVPSNQSATRLIDMGAPKGKVRVVNFGVDTNSIKCADSKARDKKDFRVAMVLSLEKHRGFDSALDAFKVLAEKIPNLSVDIYGKGSEEREFLEKIEVLGLSGNVQIISDYLHNRFMDNVCGYDVFLNTVELSNVNAMEGWVNYAMMQAMAVGIVPVSTHIAGAELIAPGETGYFIRQKDSADIVDKLEMLHKDRKMVTAMSKSAKERISLYFNAKKQTEKLEKVFDDAISSFKF